MRLLILALFAFWAAAVSAKMSCLDHNGNPVDWFMIMKMPKIVGKYEGYTAAYLDSNSPTLSSLYVHNFHYSSDNGVALTLKQLGLYGGSAPNREESLGWAMWNDATYLTYEDKKPTEHWNNTEGYNYGHAKGMFGFSAADQQGFLLQHSAPGFPYSAALSPAFFHFPYGQSYFAQHFFCVTLPLSQLEAASEVIRYFNPYVYDSNIPASIVSSLPNILALTKMHYYNGSKTVVIKSAGGQPFTLVGKDGDVQGDLYEDFVCPALKSGLTADTWCCGTFNPFCCLDSYCKGQPIVNASGPQKNQKTYAWDSTNIHDLDYGNGLAFNVSWNHAKIAIANKINGAPWVCVSDMNRMVSQRARGGGALCLAHDTLFSTMTKVVVKADTCKPRRAQP